MVENNLLFTKLPASMKIFSSAKNKLLGNEIIYSGFQNFIINDMRRKLTWH